MNNKSVGPYLIAGLIISIIAMGLLIFSYYTPAVATHTRVTNNVVTNEITNKTVNYGELKIEDVEAAIKVTVDKVYSACVGVTNRAVVNTGSKEVERNYGIGSGVIYERHEVLDDQNQLQNYEYYVITNRHVVVIDEETVEANNIVATNLYIYLGDQDLEIKATLIGYDQKVDIALISFNSPLYIEPVTLGDSKTLESGQMALAIGNPDGYDYYNAVTFGIISSPLRYISTDTDNDGTKDFYAEYIQHDVAINPGNSGGGLFNLKGELIGINTLKLVDSKIDNMGFSIPVNVVKTICCDYLAKGVAIVRPKLGILGTEIRSLTEDMIDNNVDIIGIPDIYGGETPYGIYVMGTYEGTTVDGSDIDKHDIILKINDIKITRMYIINSQLNSLEYGLKVGDMVVITYYDRSTDQIRTTKVILLP